MPDEITATLAGPPRAWPTKPSAMLLNRLIIPACSRKTAEQDEQEDVGRRDQRRDAVDALGAEVELADDLVEAEAAMRDRRAAGTDRTGRRRGTRAHTIGSARPSTRRAASNSSTTTIVPTTRSSGRRLARALDQVGLEHPVIERQRESEQPRAARRTRRCGGGRLAAERIDQEGEQQQEADVQRARDQARQRAEGRDHKLVGRERERAPATTFQRVR